MTHMMSLVDHEVIMGIPGIPPHMRGQPRPMRRRAGWVKPVKIEFSTMLIGETKVRVRIITDSPGQRPRDWRTGTEFDERLRPSYGGGCALEATLCLMPSPFPEKTTVPPYISSGRP